MSKEFSLLFGIVVRAMKDSILLFHPLSPDFFLSKENFMKLSASPISNVMNVVENAKSRECVITGRLKLFMVLAFSEKQFLS